MVTLRLFTIIIFGLMCFDSFSQTNETKLDSIIYFVKNITENENKPNKYNSIFTDGSINKKKRYFGIIGKRRAIGGFAETYTLKDSILILFRKGSRIYQDKNKEQSTNRVEEYVYKNEIICYYMESKLQEIKGKNDSLIYTLEFFIENEDLLKQKIIGNFESNLDEYLNQIIIKSKERIAIKNLLNQ